MRKVKLGDICLINMGQSPESSSYNKAGNGLPFFQGNADFGELYPNVRVWCNAPTKIANINDILISVRAPIGALNISNTKCCIGRGLAALTVKQELCFTRYLWYAISSKIDYLESKGTGSTFKAINKNSLEETEFELPEKIEQQKIASVLDKVSNLIALRKQQLSALDDLIKSQFCEMIGGLPVSTKWPMIPLGEMGENLDAKRIPVTSGSREPGPYPYYGASGIVDHVKDYIFDEDLLLISEDGANLVARVTPIAFSICGKSWVNNHAHVMRFKSRKKKKMIEYYLNFISLNDYITGTAQPKLNQEKLNRIPIPCVPDEQQSQFFAFIQQLDKSKSAIQKSLDETQLLFDSLMQKYFG